ncbi:hypothetical protein KXW18_002733 [Aspergillus fumigatus]|nr:hypothetical protein KXW18_002733 [Aspergillus fumigatus]
MARGRPQIDGDALAVVKLELQIPAAEPHLAAKRISVPVEMGISTRRKIWIRKIDDDVGCVQARLGEEQRKCFVQLLGVWPRRPRVSRRSAFVVRRRQAGEHDTLGNEDIACLPVTETE